MPTVCFNECAFTFSIYFALFVAGKRETFVFSLAIVLKTLPAATALLPAMARSEAEAEAGAAAPSAIAAARQATSLVLAPRLPEGTQVATTKITIPVSAVSKGLGE